MEKKLENKGFETKIIHCGHRVDPTTRVLASPIYQTATFGFDTVKQKDEFWDENNYMYSREGNPNLIELEKKLAIIEGGESTLTAASGMGAICSTLLTLLKSGDHIICSEGVFFHTDILMKELLVKIGVDVTFIDATDPGNVEKSIKENTKLVYFETPLNPSLDLVDIEAVSKILNGKDILLVVDSTFAPAPIQQALKLGADLVVHSLTKYINGHGDTLGGAVIGSKELIDKIKDPGMTCFTGASLPPFNAWLIMRGMMTLDMRVRKHCDSALKIATFLEGHPKVKNVIYPALESHPQHELFKKQMNGLGGGIVSFNIKDGLNGLSQHEASYKVLNNLEICTIGTSLGEAHTLIQVEKSGLTRIAVGLERAEDLIEDLKKALDQI
ncbi:trans-sulfuration enzyme family protein [Abyssisolibacter fermentans]|uniref:trans-sulfuration enzyme family protein n=1 Tax=Abyssisolibacter fermentans TaxID=1766203 RepID=UPI00082C550D|nr:PLP-dependent aspartate aminotransferase family protein [Abyssisolibacter fermentans]